MPPRPVWPAAGAAPATDVKAVVALVLGILSLLGTFCWMGLPLGIPAVVLGSLAHRDIRRSEGMSGGRGLATTGIALGTIGSLLFVGWVGFFIFAMTTAKTAATSAPPSFPASPPTTATGASTVPPGGWGSIHVVELHASAVPLRTQIEDEEKAAKTAGETVLVQTTARACVACTEVARAMRDPALQKVLADVRLVRVDASELASELRSVGMSEPSLPWFYVLDARGATRDGVSADEWDDNDAEEIAPVLDAFLRGKLRSRKRPWRGATL
jgi:hypothetical protein